MRKDKAKNIAEVAKIVAVNPLLTDNEIAELFIEGELPRFLFIPTFIKQ